MKIVLYSISSDLKNRTVIEGLERRNDLFTIEARGQHFIRLALGVFFSIFPLRLVRREEENTDRLQP